MLFVGTSIIHPSTEGVFLLCNILDLLIYSLENRMNQLVLQVTQKCNLRCSYCVYSGDYKNRNHSQKEMSWETAKEAVDYCMGIRCLAKTYIYHFMAESHY